MSGEKIPEWESELWSYISSGDGMHCSLYGYCWVRKRYDCCPDENGERINRLLDERESSLDSYDFIKSEGGGLCRIGRLVEMLAQKYLRRGGVCCLPVLEGIITLFDKQHSIDVRELPLKVYHGAIWYKQKTWIIQLKESDVLATRRFTLFHEAFHILAHCRATPVFRKRGATVGYFNELLANYFAACVLMPREWVIKKWAEVKDWERMAEIFDVPKSAMCIRLRETGLI